MKQRRKKVDCYGKFMLSHPIIQEMVQAAAKRRNRKQRPREDLPEAVFGAPNAGPGVWASLMHPMMVLIIGDVGLVDTN